MRRWRPKCVTRLSPIVTSGASGRDKCRKATAAVVPQRSGMEAAPAWGRKPGRGLLMQRGPWPGTMLANPEKKAALRMRPTPRDSLFFAVGTLAACFAMAAEALPARHEVRLASVSVAYAAGDAIGAIQSGPDCSTSTAREWSELIQRRVETELSRAFREEMAKTSPAMLRGAASRGDLNVKALVNDMKVQLCDLGKGAWRGGFQVQVGWQLMRRDGRSPVFQTTTAGSFDGHRSEQTQSAGAGLREAFAHSVRQLLANPQFVAALKLPPATDANLADATRL
jgi:hypothetical protein